MTIIQKIQKAIVNEDTDFFKEHCLKKEHQSFSLSHAMRTGRFLIIEQLLSLGFSDSIEQYMHKNIVCNFVSHYDRPDIVSLFTKHGFDISIGDYEALKQSIENNNLKTAVYILEHYDVSENAALSCLDTLCYLLDEDKKELLPLYIQLRNKVSTDNFNSILYSISDPDRRRVISHYDLSSQLQNKTTKKTVGKHKL